jgi:hypothetical protein
VTAGMDILKKGEKNLATKKLRVKIETLTDGEVTEVEITPEIDSAFVIGLTHGGGKTDVLTAAKGKYGAHSFYVLGLACAELIDRISGNFSDKYLKKALFFDALCEGEEELVHREKKDREGAPASMAGDIVAETDDIEKDVDKKYMDLMRKLGMPEEMAEKIYRNINDLAKEAADQMHANRD